MVALIMYLPSDGLVSLYLVSALFGLFQGGIVPSYAMIVREYFRADQAGTRSRPAVSAPEDNFPAQGRAEISELFPSSLHCGCAPDSVRW